MDRLMVYPGAIPLDTDILSVERNVMEALGWLTQAALGAATGVVGLPCNPTVPASMTVNIGPGALWTQAEIDQSNFGSLPADTSPLMKMGILAEAAGTNFTLTAPATSGQSINYLIEAAFEETDTNPVVLPYVNPANPAQPFTGPNNAGTPQNTTRAQRVELQLKAGVAANTGTQVTPGVDAGYVGLYVITVNFGQTTIMSADIMPYENAPFIGGPFAELAGSASQPFFVGPATQPTQAVQLAQLQSNNCKNLAVFTQAGATLNGEPIAGWVNGEEWECPSATFLYDVVGGGGGGGSSNYAVSAGGGGGAGGRGIGVCILPVPRPLTITIGGGGEGAQQWVAGGSGGSTSLDTIVTATGGGGGQSGTQANPVEGGGYGGSSGGADLNIPGSPGFSAYTIYFSGPGANSVYGSQGPESPNAGVNALGYGAGGGGAASGWNGGNGAPGIVLLRF